MTWATCPPRQTPCQMPSPDLSRPRPCHFLPACEGCADCLCHPRTSIGRSPRCPDHPKRLSSGRFPFQSSLRHPGDQSGRTSLRSTTGQARGQRDRGIVPGPHGCLTTSCLTRRGSPASQHSVLLDKRRSSTGAGTLRASSGTRRSWHVDLHDGHPSVALRLRLAEAPLDRLVATRSRSSTRRAASSRGHNVAPISGNPCRTKRRSSSVLC